MYLLQVFPVGPHSKGFFTRLFAPAPDGPDFSHRNAPVCNGHSFAFPNGSQHVGEPGPKVSRPYGEAHLTKYTQPEYTYLKKSASNAPIAPPDA
jgi:hypothetical protein